MKKTLFSAALAVAFAGSALAQSGPVKFAFIGELSGAGAVSSTNFRDGALMAIDEINAKGGILGRKIELKQYDTQTNPGTALADAKGDRRGAICDPRPDLLRHRQGQH